MPKQPDMPADDHAVDHRSGVPVAPGRNSASSVSESPGQKPGSGVQGDAETPPREYGGRKGPDPVRYGDWEKNGRCIDF